MKNSKNLRLEKIKKEMKLAEEFGYSAPNFIPLSDNFRVEGLMKIPFSQDPNCIPEKETRLLEGSNANGIIVSKNPFRKDLDSKSLVEAIECDCKNIDDTNRSQLRPRILENFQKLASQTKSYSRIKNLHLNVLTSVFGENYFKNGGDVSKRK
mgnify:CR=1 FL=1